MPLYSGKSKGALQANIRIEIANGKPPAQAAAIAHSVQRESEEETSKRDRRPFTKAKADGSSDRKMFGSG